MYKTLLSLYILCFCLLKFPRFFQDSTYKMSRIFLRLWTRHFWLDRCGSFWPDEVSRENFPSMRKTKFSASVNGAAVRWRTLGGDKNNENLRSLLHLLSLRRSSKIFVLRSEVKVCLPFKKGIVIRPRWERISFLCFPLIDTRPFENFLISSKKLCCWVLPHSAELR